MITAILIFIVIALAAAYAIERRGGGRVVVTTVRGESFRGVQRFAIRKVILTSAEALAGENATELAGRLEIHRRSVAMIQRLPLPAPAKAPAADTRVLRLPERARRATQAQ